MTTTDVRRVFGVPVSFSGLTNAGARLRAFEPENPSLFVPRSMGIGWALNVGAVAVRLGLLRPDDSVPELVDHIPPALIKALRVGPLVGAAAVTIAGAYAAKRHERLPTNWGLALRPTRWGNSATAMAIPLALSVSAGLWAELATRQANKHHQDPTVDVSASADALGLQAMALMLVIAADRHAADPQASRFLPLAGVVAAPAVSTAVLATTVRAALRQLDQKLRGGRSQR